MLNVTVRLAPPCRLGTAEQFPTLAKFMTNQLRKDLLQTSTRRSGAKHAHLQRKIKIQHIADALLEAGYDLLDDQARALGVSPQYGVDHCAGQAQA